jgi:hypothetical protein
MSLFVQYVSWIRNFRLQNYVEPKCVVVRLLLSNTKGAFHLFSVSNGTYFAKDIIVKVFIVRSLPISSLVNSIWPHDIFSLI